MRLIEVIVVVVVPGFVGFAATLGYDLLQLRHANRLLPPVAIIGAIGVGLSTFGLCFVVSLPPQHFAITVGCAILAGVSFLMLVWSVVLEIPILLRGAVEARENQATDPAPAAAAQRRVINRGTYGLSRHPGLLWYFMLVLFVVLLFRHPVVLGLGVYLFLLDLVVVLVEDALIFPKLFVDYDRYKREVPMLVPGLRRTKSK